MEAQWWLWLAFGLFVVVMFLVDFTFFGRDRTAKISLRTAAIWSLVWLGLGLAFAGVLFFWQGSRVGSEYLAGFLIEKTLSTDNLFVFALVFAYFGVPGIQQHRVLFWGIIGALVLRGALIVAGATLIDAFHFTLYIFGGFLIFTGIRMLTHQAVEIHPQRNPVLKLLGKVMPIAPDYHGDRFTILRGSRRFATPLLGALLLVASLDVVFAVDSIPAIFGVTNDLFIIFAANAFSLLGLGALYFVLVGMLDRFHYLTFGLAIVLAFIGVKMVLTDVVHLPTWLSLGVVVLVLAVTVVASLFHKSPTSPVKDDKVEVKL